MLRQLLVLGFFLFPGLLSAQPYKPLLKKGANWIEHVYSMLGPGYDSTYSIFQQDTTIYTLASHPYRKYEVVADSLYNTLKVLSAAYLYDDSVNRKVYVFTAGAEKLLYDFSKSAGDTIKNVICNGSTTWMVVDSVKSGTFHGILRRMFYVSDTTNNQAMSVLWVEGLGGEKGLFHPAVQCLPTDPVYQLNCIFLNTTPQYGVNCNFIYTGLDQITPEASIRLASNPPIAGILRLIHNSEQKLNWNLYDMSGRQLRSGQQDVIAVSDLMAGIYILRVKSGTFTTSFMVSW